jgi:hypothetical protein
LGGLLAVVVYFVLPDTGRVASAGSAVPHSAAAVAVVAGLRGHRPANPRPWYQIATALLTPWSSRSASGLTSILLPLADVVLLAVLVRLWSGGGQRPTAYWLLGLAVVALLAADTGYGVVSLQGPFRPGSSIDIGFIMFPLCCGAAALHPSMAAVAAPGTAMASRARPRWRLALLGLEANRRRGDDLRIQLWHRSRTVLDHLDKLGIATPNATGVPLTELALADPADMDAVGRHLFDRGIYVAMTPYPVVPRAEVGFRVQLTAANPLEQVDHLLNVLQEVDGRFGFRRPHP